MKSTSPRQIELDLSDIQASDAGSASAGISSGPNTQAGSQVGTLKSILNDEDALSRNILGENSRAYAITAKMAGRMNAAAIPEEEYQGYLRERAELLTRKFAGGLSRREEVRLRYVRWNLDRIDDARHGQGLDVMEGLVAQYEHVLAQMQNLEHDLNQHTKRR